MFVGFFFYFTLTCTFLVMTLYFKVSSAQIFQLDTFLVVGGIWSKKKHEIKRIQEACYEKTLITFRGVKSLVVNRNVSFYTTVLDPLHSTRLVAN